MEPQFKNYIVLMLENRSFDHLFGYLGVQGMEGLPAGGATNYLVPGDSSSDTFSSQKGGDYTAVGEGPSHSLKQTNEQLFGVTNPAAGAVPSLDGFVASMKVSLQYDLRRAPTSSELQQVMNAFDPVQLPVLSALAQNYVLCDHWFADVPGPTMPNRAFVHAATSAGYTDNAGWKPDFSQVKTLYDRLNDAGISWRIYYHDQDDLMQLYPNLKSGTDNHSLFVNYASDVAGNKLATYSFITPEFLGTPEQPVNSMHAPKDVRPGEKLVADVYSALLEHPEVWQDTLLIVVFDEHGGYYDHVVPPAAVSPDGIPGRLDEAYLVPFDFNRLGLRVPAILISPWFPQAVDHTVYSHSTIPGSILDSFGLPFLTQRDTQANKLTNNYLQKNASRQWRTDIPNVTVPVQPQSIDVYQREMLDGSVHIDPDPKKRDIARTEDIRDPAEARRFMQVQVAKRLEHNIASNWGANPLPTDSAYRELPGPTVSPARIAELRRPASPPGPRP